ncbi:thioredoxin domain-containing protein [Microbacterium ulmi]|uniref:Thioredoxin domain-containing protein n=1 Tax=Microbacterium ulmi TaxID=179095 RepID=A0A7Y2PZ57_9MICO|nr:DUF255 domain-containing protein [Microbacterium ulmi]NII69295.1 hypothetical protein [Microbacterium ulmi]NNH04091.1 thioredoxin domain-containing protein [Microbacterium ulmi]
MIPANALAGSASPYLLAHANDPVRWQPWGADAVAQARQRGVPLFVSIGYATCHWCHVMARESFRDPAVAELLNERFVPVKVDREEHPEVDAHFLGEAERFTGRLGWPLNVAVSAEGVVGFAGTYFPPEPRPGLDSFTRVLEEVDARWRAGRFAAPPPRPAPHLEERGGPDLDEAVRRMLAREDAVFGGFGTASKFPIPPALGFLADRASLGDEIAAGLVDRTLLALIRSPLRDRVDGGIFRYATRRDWKTPHYERMLVDNAQLLRVLAIRASAAEDAAARAELRTAAEGIASFLARVLRLPEGGFASAQDSESIVDGERSEGGYYLLDADGRSAHPAPSVDDKLVAGHNGLAIAALSVAGRLLGRADWVALAVEAADAVARRHRLPGGGLVRVTRRVGSRLVVSPAPSTLEDYGLLAWGLSELALVTGERARAEWAIELVDAALAPDGGFRPPRADPVLGEADRARAAETASPSGVSAIAQAAWTLHLLTGEERYATPVRALAAKEGRDASAHPLEAAALLWVLLAAETPGQQLVTVAGRPALDERSRRHYRAGGIVAVLPAEAMRELAAAGLTVLADRGEDAAAHLCAHFACLLPVRDAEALEAALVAP